jgi:hypothetical protein
VCESCGESSAVSVPDALASFCLRCGAVTIDGVRLDVDGVMALRRVDPLSTAKGSCRRHVLVGAGNTCSHQQFGQEVRSIYGAKRAQPVATGRKWGGAETG